MRIRTQERDIYEAIWQVPGYSDHSPGEQMVSKFLAMSHADPSETVLDAGCGSGKGAMALLSQGFDVHLCDMTGEGVAYEARILPFTPVCLWDDLQPQVGMFDWVYCCDVLEHIPPQFTMLTIHRLLSVSRKGLFLSISLVPDRFGVWAGRSLHQTVQSFTEWRDQLSELGTVVECRDLLNCGLYLVAPK